MRYLTWLMWTFAYLFRPKPTELVAYLTRSERTRPPWWKFKPSLYHNDAGKQWEIWFDNESCYSQTSVISVTAHVGMESGEIVGFTIWDETLKKPIKDNA